jgi:hypothetical protein
MRKVVYIFEREGDRGGRIWWLVLDCGHSVARKCPVVNRRTVMIHSATGMRAPKRCVCHYCGSGHAKQNPSILVKMLGGSAP